MFVNGLWHFRGACTTTILYHVHHSQTGFLHLCLRFWWAHRHPAAREVRSRRPLSDGSRLPSTQRLSPLAPEPTTWYLPVASQRRHVLFARVRPGVTARPVPPAGQPRHDVGELGIASAAAGHGLAGAALT